MATENQAIEYQDTYLWDGPGKGRQRTDFSAMLFVEIITTTPKGRLRRKKDVMEFVGATRDEAEQKMMDWITRVGAQAIDAAKGKGG
jgi:hypothetical protein